MKKKAVTLLGWIVSIVAISFLIAKVDFHKIWQGLLNAKWQYLLLAMVINFTVIAMKTVRWQWFMQPQTKTRFFDIFRATMIGLAGNNVLPARGGDLLKIYLISKWENVSKTSVVSITGLDKIFEGISFLVIFGLLSMHFVFPIWVRRGTIFMSIAVSAMLAISIILLLHRKKTYSSNPDELRWFGKFANQLGAGLVSLMSRRIIVCTVLISLAICAVQIVMILLCQMAFGIVPNIWMAALVFIAVNLAIMIPSAPSGVGPFEAAFVLAYTWLGVETETAFNIAITYHAIQFLPVTAIGLIMYYQTHMWYRKSDFPKVVVENSN